MKRKITLSTLEELSGAISHNDLANYLGGGSGTRNNPYTFSEYMALGESFQNGWVQFSDDNISYLTENYPSYCGNSTYCGSGYEGSTNYWGNTWGGNSNCYHGSNYNYTIWGSYEFDVLNNCSSSLLSYMERYGIKIDSAARMGPYESVNHIYNGVDNTIHINSDIPFEYEQMIHEFTHAFQKHENLENDRIYKEFQAYIASKIAAAIKGYPIGGFGCDWVNSLFYDDYDQLDMNKFYDGLREQYDEFCLDRYSNYYRGDKPDVPYFCYNFKWEELFRTIGIKMK